MTEQERTARLEAIVETWNRVLDRHEAEMTEMRRRTDRMVTDITALRTEVAHMRGWLIGAVAVMAVFTALNALVKGI